MARWTQNQAVPTEQLKRRAACRRLPPRRTKASSKGRQAGFFQSQNQPQICCAGGSVLVRFSRLHSAASTLANIASVQELPSSGCSMVGIISPVKGDIGSDRDFTLNARTGYPGKCHSMRRACAEPAGLRVTSVMFRPRIWGTLPIAFLSGTPTNFSRSFSGMNTTEKDFKRFMT